MSVGPGLLVLDESEGAVASSSHHQFMLGGLGSRDRGGRSFRDKALAAGDGKTPRPGLSPRQANSLGTPRATARGMTPRGLTPR